MALNTDTTFEGKLTCAFKNDMRNLANFHQSTCESFFPRKSKFQECQFFSLVNV